MKYFLAFLALLSPLSVEARRHQKVIAPLYEMDERDSREQELLAARRINCLIKDKEFSLARQQIYAFFDRFPASGKRDLFQVQLGKIALIEKEYEAAVAAFDAIRNPKTRDEMRLKRWQALYQLQSYELLYQEISPILALLKGKERREATFLVAEATFREAMILSHYKEGKQKAKELAKEALAHFDTIVRNKRYSAHAKLASAEIYRLLDQPKEAATLYLELAQSETENEELLFHAAAMLAKFDESKAAEIFHKVAYIGGIRSSESTYQWMQLLAKNENFEPLFSEKDLFLTKLPSFRMPLFHFYRGMAHYQKKRWQEAAPLLGRSLDLGLIYPYDKNALFALIVCGHELNDLEIVERGYAPVQERYPAELGDVALLRALVYKNVGLIEEALAQFDLLIELKHSATVVERSMREKTEILIAQEKWQEAYTVCCAYQERFESQEMVKLAIDLCLNLDQNHLELVQHIEKGLNYNLFVDEEKAFYLNLMAKGLIKIERYEEAFAILQKLEVCAEHESLLTLCSLKQGFRPEQIIVHGERALELDSSLPEADRLHLYLFNAYLDAAKESQDQQFNHFAEEHLYCIIHSYPVSLENRLWLAHRFAKNEEKKERAIEIFEALLHSSGQISRFPREAFVLADLYTERSEHERAGELLQQLTALDEKSEFGDKIQLALAHHLGATGNTEEAIELYEQLENSDQPMVSARAKLQRCRLLFDHEATAVALKMLWMKKRIQTEPVHLEAAVDYLELQANRMNKDELLELANEIHDHFTLEDDIWSKDYHTARYQMPSRDLIYQAYMRYIEAFIAETEGEQKKAHALFSTLCHGKYAVSKYLVESANRRVR
ncbi:MAG: hypothetical protein K0U13_03860 [Chlamydiae bacterium]|nr:hypothetical protein [Chlamydiota bacterium]